MAESTSALDDKGGKAPGSPRRRSTLPVPLTGGGGGVGGAPGRGGAGGAAGGGASLYVDKNATFAPHLIPDDDRSKVREDWTRQLPARSCGGLFSLVFFFSIVDLFVCAFFLFFFQAPFFGGVFFFRLFIGKCCGRQYVQ